jgi:hypothetical protein
MFMQRPSPSPRQRFARTPPCPDTRFEPFRNLLERLRRNHNQSLDIDSSRRVRSDRAQRFPHAQSRRRSDTLEPDMFAVERALKSLKNRERSR